MNPCRQLMYFSLCPDERLQCVSMWWSRRSPSSLVHCLREKYQNYDTLTRRCPIDLVSALKWFVTITLKVVDSYPKYVLTQNNVWCEATRMVIIDFMGTSKHFKTNKITTFYIISYRMCASNNTIPSAYLLILMRPIMISLFNPDFIALYPLVPLHLYRVITSAFSATLIVQTLIISFLQS